MDETRPSSDAEERLEHTADELDDRLHRLEDHLEDARDKARERREAESSRAVAGEPDDDAGD
jgi:hypothetical protein